MTAISDRPRRDGVPRSTRRAFATALSLSMLPGAARTTAGHATPAATPAATPSGPQLVVTPTEVAFDERFDVWLTGLEPGQAVTLTSTFEGYGSGFTAEATFVADDLGIVDLASHAPVDGDWWVADTMGLIWSATGKTFYRWSTTGSEPITITATSGDQVIGEKTIARTILPEGRAPEYIDEDDMVANYYAPVEDEPAPALIVLGGSEGGLSEYADLIASMLAARGYATLALAYFGVGTLPPGLSRIPLEYFEHAIGWLREQAGVDPERIGVVGVSRGAELALLLGSRWPEIKAVVSYVGTGYVHAEFVGPGSDLAVSAWTWRGEAIPHQSSFDMTEAEMRAVEISVERINGPVLLIGGEADVVWPSSYLSEVAWARLQREGHEWPDQILRYPGAGHGISLPPYQPVASPHALALGGDAHSNATAMANAWPAACQMLDTRLKFGWV